LVTQTLLGPIFMHKAFLSHPPLSTKQASKSVVKTQLHKFKKVKLIIEPNTEP